MMLLSEWVHVDNEVMERLIIEAIRTIDATTNELNYVIEKYPQHYEMIDLEARNSFPNGLLTWEIKHTAAFNMQRNIEYLPNESKED